VQGLRRRGDHARARAFAHRLGQRHDDQNRHRCRTADRLLRFAKSSPAPATRTWQGTSSAEWERIPQPGGLGVSIQQAPPRVGTLKVVTTGLRSGYLGKNGVPDSDETTVTEYFDRVSAYESDWLTVLTIVDDPTYLTQQFITSTHFKREPDALKWMPTPCEPAASAAR
jgi:hypothetical protein